MRVLHIIPSLNKGGAERLVLDICIQLQKESNVTCQLITFRDENKYRFLSQDVNWEVIPAFVGLSISGKSKIDIDKLQDEIDSFAPDIIHSHLFETELVLSQINTRAKRIIHFHNNINEFSKIKLLHGFNKRTLTNAFERHIVIRSLKNKSVTALAISNDSMHFIEKNLPSFINKTFLPNAIDLKRFFKSSQVERQPRIVLTGRLFPVKGHRLALEVMQVLKNRSIHLHLDFLGDGPEKNSLLNYAEELNVEDQVTFHGTVDHPESYLEKASIYLHTAIYEPFGLALIEAMASGLPIVCTDGKGNSDLIENGKNGFLIKSRNPIEVADKIELLWRDENLRLKMGNYAQEFCKKFGIVNYSKNLVQIYNDLNS